ncbi:hypothetical protein VTH06DRAFT_939 [Thermothelomyces fergusii]
MATNGFMMVFGCGQDFASSGSPFNGKGEEEGKKDGPTEGEEPLEFQNLSVIVYQGASYDSYNKRHCALAIEHKDEAGNRWRLNTIDIEGVSRRWRVREAVDRDPWQSRSFYGAYLVKSFTVGRGAGARADRQLRDSIYNARINNDDEEWNCQNGLEEALKRLKAARFLTDEEVEAALSAALNMVLEAPDEPLPLY